MNYARQTDNLRQLNHLVALAECGDFGRAADRLSITKSALSQSLQRLEDIYGVPLFLRGRRKLSATIYGEILIETARRMTRLFDDARRQIDLLQNLECGRLVIGCDPLLADSLLAPALVQIIAKFPKLEFTQTSGNWMAMREDVRRGDIDIFVGLLPDKPLEGYQIDKLQLPALKAFVRAGHPLLSRENLTIDDCRDYPMLVAPVPDWYVQRTTKAARRGRLTFEYIRASFLTSDSTSLIRDIVCASDAISGDFAASLGPDIEAGRLKLLHLREEEFHMPLPAVIVTPLDRALPPSAAHLAEALKRAAEQMGQSVHQDHRSRCLES